MNEEGKSVFRSKIPVAKDVLKNRAFLCGSYIIELGDQHAQWKSRISQSSDQQILL